MSSLLRTNKSIRNRYGAAALFCLLFSAVYEVFSHGVASAWMLSMPVHLCISAILFHILYRLCRPVCDWFRSLWLCGVSTLTVCSCLRGVFEIYGTEFPFFWLLWSLGNTLAVMAIIAQRRGPVDVVDSM